MTQSDGSPVSSASTVPRSALLVAGGAAGVVTALPSGLALVATASNCNSNPDGDTTNPDWTFSAYCETLALHPYADSRSHGDGLVAGIFALPVVVVVCATIAAVHLRSVAPIVWAFGIGLAMIVVLFALDVVLAHASFHDGA
ncbi:MAG TPA: hypothetical protein VG165_14745 [Solirubrobacteraceae bacterium]|jgi:hypothetical protein|nr:hypothetical protein [Solirubrobacteraceae bacterium]